MTTTSGEAGEPGEPGGTHAHGGDDWRELNRAWWDERVAIHSDSAFYDLAGFVADPGATTLRAFELAEMGDVAGRTLVHLQCHFGLDTLSWARRGARVVGLDFSGPAVATARAAAADAGLEAEFVQGDVYDAVALLGGRTFDVVYTGLGALNWLPDLGRWARVAAALVAPGGFLYLPEFHPLHHVFADDGLTVAHPYFQDGPQVWDEPGTYVEVDAATEHNRTHEWTHGLGDVVSAVIDAGLVVEHLHEFDHTLFQRWPFLVRDPAEAGVCRMPAGRPSLPLMYSVRARKPA